MKIGKTLLLTGLALAFGVANTVITNKCDDIKLKEAVAEEVTKQINKGSE